MTEPLPSVSRWLPLDGSWSRSAHRRSVVRTSVRSVRSLTRSRRPRTRRRGHLVHPVPLPPNSAPQTEWVAERPSHQQAAAAVGQNILIFRYQESLRRYSIVAGQLLLTAGDLENPTSHSNAQRALNGCSRCESSPSSTRTSTVATHEIRFGDNDRSASLVAELARADLLVYLSDVDALYARPPHEPGAR